MLSPSRLHIKDWLVPPVVLPILVGLLIAANAILQH